MENCGISSDAKMADSPEESSWTFYIQGFMCENDDRNSCFSSEYESPSLVSDADSSAIKKLANLGFHNNNSPGKSSISRTICKQNSFKKQHKTRSVKPAVDIELEDTASSPVNSPRVCYMNQFFNQKEKNKIDASEVKRIFFAKDFVERDTDYIVQKVESPTPRAPHAPARQSYGRNKSW